MQDVDQDFLLGFAGVAGTLLGTFVVGVFFYIGSEMHMRLGARRLPIDTSGRPFGGSSLRIRSPSWFRSCSLRFILCGARSRSACSGSCLWR